MSAYAGFRPPERGRNWHKLSPQPLTALARSIAAAGRCACPVIVGKSGEPNRPNRLGRPGIGVSSACAGCGGKAS